MAVAAVLANGALTWLFPAGARGIPLADAAMLLAIGTAGLLSFAGRLPWQNVLASSAIFLVVQVAGITFERSLPSVFGQQVHADYLGARYLGHWPWPVWLMGLVSLLLARGVVCRAPDRYRHSAHFGWWLIGTTALLVTLLEFAFQPWAVHGKGYWFWITAEARPMWLASGWPHLALVFLTALVAQVLATPWLIDKRPGRYRPGLQSVVLWGAALLWMVSGLARINLWALALAALALLAVVVGSSVTLRRVRLR